MRRPGFSLVELVVCIALLGMVVGFVVNLLPSSALAMQRASDLSSAAAYGAELLENARTTPVTMGGTDRDVQTQLGVTRFHVVRTWYAVSGETGLWDVVVTVQGPRGTPLVLASRVNSSVP